MTYCSVQSFKAVIGIIALLFSFGGQAQKKPSVKSRLPQPIWSSPTKANYARQSTYHPKKSKINPTLWGLYQEFEAQPDQETWRAYVQKKGYHETLPLRQNQVIIEAVAEHDSEALRTTLEGLGLEQTATFGRIVSGWLPIGQVDKLEEIANLRFVRPSYRPVTKVGSVTSQGDGAQGSDLVRNACHLDGAGVTVGILSDSYNSRRGEAAGIASGDLPGPGNPNGNLNPAMVLSDLAEGEGSDEGRAMAEIVHDVAPEATLAFHTAALGLVDFAQGILALAQDAGADVIVDDVGYLEDAFFQDGIVAQAVDSVARLGVTYVSAAGNDARQSYESEFRPASDTIELGDAVNSLGNYVLHDFDPGPGVDYFQRVTISSLNTIYFQWSQAYASICATSLGAASDLDIFIFTREGDFSSALFRGNAQSTGADPLEVLGVETDFTTEVYIVIGKFVGFPGVAPEIFPGITPDPARIKYIFTGGELNEEYATNSGTIFAHPNAAGSIAVGAVPYFATPTFGADEPVLEPFSSAGGTPILLTPCGQPITPKIRQKPEVCAPDEGNTTFFGFDREEDGFPNFSGTSASAPHVAGVAALMKQAAPDLEVDSVARLLQRTALDMDDPFTPGPDPGFDFGTGFGLVQAEQALSALTHCVGVARLELYNADTDSLVAILRDGDQFSAQTLGNTNLALRAVTVPEQVGSVKISIRGGLASQRVENFLPYTSFGDNNPSKDNAIDYNGRVFAFGFQPESYTIEVIAFSEPQAQGDTMGATSLSFTLVDELLTGFSLVDTATSYREDNQQGPADSSLTLLFSIDGSLPGTVVSGSVANATPTVFPNPLTARSTSLNIRWSEPPRGAAPATFRLLNQQGQELLRQRQNTTGATEEHRINLQSLDLPMGIYLLRIERADATSEVIRILKK